jgi:starch phosphorylase
MNDDQTFAGRRELPERLRPLRELAYNLRWTWDRQTQDLFASLDASTWEDCEHNPLLMLQAVSLERLDQAATDPAFLARIDEAVQARRDTLNSDRTWFDQRAEGATRPLIAYFSAEFGVSETLPIYAGGLGVLAGDHLKAASDLGLPLVAVGLFYYQGYFRQTLDGVGWQQDHDRHNDPSRLPIELVRGSNGEPLTVTVEFPDRQATAQIWRAQVGRIPLYLLDMKVAGNWPEDQAISDRLYGGDLETRIRQEIVLGIGGHRALEALGLQPDVIHMNEGHSAFLSLERARRIMRAQELTFEEAARRVRVGSIFTTHTPVAAGHDYFPSALMRSYFRPFAHELGLEWQEFMALGRVDPSDQQAAFGMTTLAINMSTGRNGVSKLHGEVTRHMWAHLWPGVAENDIPIGHVTNGVHMPTWVSGELAALYDQYIGDGWRSAPSTRDDWSAVASIPDATLWSVHTRKRERLIKTVRQRLAGQIARLGASDDQLSEADRAFDPAALTIGFARRFTAYKRATLILTDVERLARILNDAERPVQLIFAGKAHPRDDPGKLLIQRIASVSSRPSFRHKLIFLEDYDMALARCLVQGVDVWLNNPIRPQEASGTSGMKAAANGALNLSTLDGWWDEAWRETQALGDTIGWSIQTSEHHADDAARDRAEANALYDVLEREVIPAFYDCNSDGLPAAWIARMKSAIHNVGPAFSANRMVADYTEDYYLPAAARVREIVAPAD